jgi:hypothetical protein
MAFESFTVEDIATRGATIHTLRRGAGPHCFFCMGTLRRIHLAQSRRSAF